MVAWLRASTRPRRSWREGKRCGNSSDGGNQFATERSGIKQAAANCAVWPVLLTRAARICCSPVDRQLAPLASARLRALPIHGKLTQRALIILISQRDNWRHLLRVWRYFCPSVCPPPLPPQAHADVCSPTFSRAHSQAPKAAKGGQWRRWGPKKRAPTWWWGANFEPGPAGKQADSETCAPPVAGRCQSSKPRSKIGAPARRAAAPL